MFGKLAEARQKAEEIKKKLDAITVEGESDDRKVKVVVTGNKKVTDVFIADELLDKGKKQELQDSLMIAIERSMQAAEHVSQSEMQALMSKMMPGGLDKLFGK